MISPPFDAVQSAQLAAHSTLAGALLALLKWPSLSQLAH